MTCDMYILQPRMQAAYPSDVKTAPLDFCLVAL